MGIMELKERNVSTQLVREEPTPTSHSQKKKEIVARRPELDVIIVGLTWGILLVHVCLIYSPWILTPLTYPDKLEKPMKEDAYTIIPSIYIVEMFIGFMNAWPMPMFFYLSGLNTYYALFGRTETQFRDNRVHRLLVPTLFTDLVTQLPMTLAYFAPNNLSFGG